MGESSDLLRMLEPTVRPTGVAPAGAAPRAPIESQGFDEVLRRAAQDPTAGGSRALKMSAHAQQRLQERGVALSETQMHALADAADRAEAKGARDTLMLMDRLGLIVNIPNRTVLTVLPAERMREGIVTNIDSTVIVDESAGVKAPPHRLQL